MAIMIPGPVKPINPVTQLSKEPVRELKLETVKPDNTELVKHLATQVIELGRMVEKLSEPKPEQPKKVDVLATIQRDKDGKMESILITHRA